MAGAPAQGPLPTTPPSFLPAATACEAKLLLGAPRAPSLPSSPAFPSSPSTPPPAPGEPLPPPPPPPWDENFVFDYRGRLMFTEKGAHDSMVVSDQGVCSDVGLAVLQVGRALWQ